MGCSGSTVPRKSFSNVAKKSKENISIRNLKGPSSLCPSAKIPVAHGCIIIFDFDDTLIPTSFLYLLMASNPQSLSLNEQQYKYLFDLSYHTFIMLQQYIHKYSSQCIKIITAASFQWIKKSFTYLGAVGYFNQIHDLLFNKHKIEVISPNPYHLPFKSAADKRRYKTDAFIRVCHEQLSRYKVHSIVSIGDDSSEYLASRQAGNKYCKNIRWVHRIKLISRPLIVDMIEQMQFLLLFCNDLGFDHISKCDAEIDIDYRLFQHISQSITKFEKTNSFIKQIISRSYSQSSI